MAKLYEAKAGVVQIAFSAAVGDEKCQRKTQFQITIFHLMETMIKTSRIFFNVMKNNWLNKAGSIRPNY